MCSKHNQRKEKKREEKYKRNNYLQTYVQCACICILYFVNQSNYKIEIEIEFVNEDKLQICYITKHSIEIEKVK